MGQSQSTTKEKRDEKSVISSTDEEHEHDDVELRSVTDEECGGTETVVTISPLPPPKSFNDSDDNSSCEVEQETPFLFNKKRLLIVVILTVVAVLVVSITAPLVVESSKKGKSPDVGGADLVDDYYGDAPVINVGEIPAQDSTLPPVYYVPIDGNQTDGGNHHKEPISPEGSTAHVDEGTDAPSFLPKLPFDDVNLPYFEPEVMGGYNNRAEFEQALTEAAKFLINKVVLQNLGYAMVDNSKGFQWRTSEEEQSQGFRDVTDFETNNQKLGIDEADLIKADSNYVYAAYSNYVLVWDTSGNQVAQAKMPTNSDNNNGGSSSSFGGGIFSGSAFGTMSGQKAHVESLLVTGDYLVVIVSTYAQESGERTALVNYMGTQIRTYKTTSIAADGELLLVGVKDVNGKFMDARSIGSQVHVATISGIDSYSYLMAPFNRFINFPGLSDEEYVKQVRSLALDQYIPAFVQKLTNELLVEDQDQNEILPNLLQLNQWQSSPDEDNSQGRPAAGMFQTGILNSVSFVTSLDVTAAPIVSQLRQELVTTTSALVAPSYHIHLYGTASKIVLATAAWNWDADLEATEEVTHLVVLKLEDQNSALVTTSFHSLGTVRGYVLNPHSLDIEGSDLRVATTVARRWRFHATPRPSSSSSTVDVGNYISGRAADRGRSADDKNFIQESLTENYITVFDLDSNDILKERGSLQLGEKDEVITAVRFFEDTAYCVTFQQKDPFYVVDLKNIEILGSFQMNGFSNYIHPLNEEQTLLVGIGQNATEDGAVNGFMITVFDVADPTNPKAIVRYALDDSPPGSDGAAIQSTAQWDYKSFRYVDGKLILPLDITTYSTEGSTSDAIVQTIMGSFEGFVVFNVAADSINEHIRISHSTSACHYCGYLAPRSFVYDGNVLTAEGNIVSSTSLYNRQDQWSFHVAVIGEEARCCY